uniref:DUF4291 domain-containing protein n=1 Tax=Strombidinopsis acuminata TaxID=141414 RepID=A0A7S3VXH2_9SPIT
MYEVRAVFTETTVRVYQAYNAEIASAAVANQRFVAPWSPDRMTWIKPSAAWMGYRSGWGSKDKNQARVLAVDLHREGFEWLLATARLAKCQDGKKTCDVVVQWDPERGLGGDAGKNAWTHPLLQQRSLQMGIRGAATVKYAEELVAAITDVTSLFDAVGQRLAAGDTEGAAALLPKENIYPLSTDLAILRHLSPEGSPPGEKRNGEAPAADEGASEPPAAHREQFDEHLRREGCLDARPRDAEEAARRLP